MCESRNEDEWHSYIKISGHDKNISMEGIILSAPQYF